MKEAGCPLEAMVNEGGRVPPGGDGQWRREGVPWRRRPMEEGGCPLEATVNEGGRVFFAPRPGCA
eukprot:363192-Chlamydomonas_euryale.AAC.8